MTNGMPDPEPYSWAEAGGSALQNSTVAGYFLSETGTLVLRSSAKKTVWRIPAAARTSGNCPP